MRAEESDTDLSLEGEGQSSSTSIDGLTKDDIPQLQAQVDALQEKYALCVWVGVFVYSRRTTSLGRFDVNVSRFFGQ